MMNYIFNPHLLQEKWISIKVLGCNMKWVTFPSLWSHFLSGRCTNEKFFPLQTSDDNVPLCGGLIHRTEAGWKHCVERFAGTGSKMFSSRESTDTFQDKEEQGRISPPAQQHKENFPDDSEYDHFYYIDGVMRRVQNNFYPYYKRQRRRKRSHENTGDGVFTGTKTGNSPENLLGYIRLVAERKKSQSLPMIRRWGWCAEAQINSRVTAASCEKKIN